MSAARSLFIASLTLFAGPATLPALTPQALGLQHDAAAHVLKVSSSIDASVLLVAGAHAAEPIRIGGIEIHVMPDVVLPLGLMTAGDILEIPLPADLGGIGVQLVGIELPGLALHASNAVFLPDLDLVIQSFRAVLGPMPDGVKGVHVSLTAPTSGYELIIDGIQYASGETNAYFRLIQPGSGEVTMPVLEPHSAAVALPEPAGRVVHVHLMRETRGKSGLPYYQRMASLPLGGSAGAR